MAIQHFLTSLFVLVVVFCQGQTVSNFNLDFEKNTINQPLPDDWIKWGMPNYIVQSDTSESHSGIYSATIYPGFIGDSSSFGAIAYGLPVEFEGKEIRLEGFMKIDLVENGFAGLVLRIDGIGKTLAFDNMQSQNIQGSHDWKKYIVSLPLAENAQQIMVGGLLTGSGQAWFDSFKVFVDNTPIEELIQPIILSDKASLDKEFDNGSGIDIDSCSDIQLSNLHKLAKIWGFIKYHHPDVALGNFNWDYELFRVLPSIIASTNYDQTDQEIETWLNILDQPTGRKLGSPKPDDIKLQANTSWIEDPEFLGRNLTQQLAAIRDISKPRKHYYLDFVPNVGNPIFKNEQVYPQMDYQDDGLKLLALFRYWSMIEYFFPYRHLMDHNWDSVLVEFIPRMIAANDEMSYTLTLLELIGNVQDTHANIWGNGVIFEFWGKRYAPLKVKVVEDQFVTIQLVEDAQKTGVEVGDIITKINEQDVWALVKQNLKYAPASNYITQLRDLSRNLLRTNEDTLVFTIANKGTLSIPTVDRLPMEFWKKMCHRIGCLMIVSGTYIREAWLRVKLIRS